MTPDPATPEQIPPACAAFEQVVQAVLDREAGPEALDGPHPDGCAACRELAAAARLLLAAPPFPAPRPELTDRIVSAALGDRRAQLRVRWVRRAAVVALAASVLVAGYLVWGANRSDSRPSVAQSPTPPEPVPPPTPQPLDEPAPRVSDRVADAGAALAALTRKATDQTVTPARNLLPPPGQVSLPTAEVPGVEPAAESLAGMPHAAQTGIEPVARSTRRAVNLFLRDTGLAPAKPDL